MLRNVHTKTLLNQNRKKGASSFPYDSNKITKESITWSVHGAILDSNQISLESYKGCLLYTSDAADE